MREIERLEGLLSGVRKLVRPPDMLFVVDVSREATAIHEANLLNIPVVAMVDTNCDPSNVDYVIPSNDDAIRAIKLVVGKIADAAVEGLGARKEEIVEEEIRMLPELPKMQNYPMKSCSRRTLAKLKHIQ
jgi:small subunit ribosomal protein S2